MPKKAKSEAQDEQSARFQAEVDRMIAAGELSPTEADERFEKLMKNLPLKRITPPEGAA